MTYIINADGSLVFHEIGKGPYASWSPDGSRIASVGTHAEEGDPTKRSDVFLSTMAPEGSDLRVILRIDEDGRLITEKR